jgi:hypothetical protein
VICKVRFSIFTKVQEESKPLHNPPPSTRLITTCQSHTYACWLYFSIREINRVLIHNSLTEASLAHSPTSSPSHLPAYIDGNDSRPPKPYLSHDQVYGECSDVTTDNITSSYDSFLDDYFFRNIDTSSATWVTSSMRILLLPRLILHCL